MSLGAIVSADIAVPEHEREGRFYARVLRTGADPLWRDDLMNSQGQPIIGLGERAGQYADLPLQWMPQIQVARRSRTDAYWEQRRDKRLGGAVRFEWRCVRARPRLTGRYAGTRRTRGSNRLG